MTTSCCLVTVIALVKRQLYIANILGGVEGRVCLAMSCFIFGTLLTEHGFKKGILKVVLLFRVPSKYQTNVIVRVMFESKVKQGKWKMLKCGN